jgi:hypothetical protein
MFKLIGEDRMNESRISKSGWGSEDPWEARMDEIQNKVLPKLLLVLVMPLVVLSFLAVGMKLQEGMAKHKTFVQIINS